MCIRGNTNHVQTNFKAKMQDSHYAEPQKQEDPLFAQKQEWRVCHG